MKRTALLVIDLQRGAFDGIRTSVISEPDRLIRNATALIDAARESSTPIIFLQHCEGPGEIFEEGSVHGQLHESLAPRPGETILKKRKPSAFEKTNLEQILRDLRVEQVIVCGLQSEFCIFSTAEAALKLGFDVVVAADAHSTWPDKAEPASAISDRINEKLRAAGAELRLTEELVQSWREPRVEAHG